MKKFIFITILLFLISFTAFGQVRIENHVGYWRNFYPDPIDGIEDKLAVSVNVYKNLEIQINTTFGLHYEKDLDCTIFCEPDLGLLYNFDFNQGWSLRPMFFTGCVIAGYKAAGEKAITGVMFDLGLGLDIAVQLNETFELIMSVSYSFFNILNPFEVSCGLGYIIPKKHKAIPD